MARLNDESQPDSRDDVSDYILSPQPCALPSKEVLLSSFQSSHLRSEHGSAIDDSQLSTRDYEYSSSSSSTRHSTSDIFGREVDEELEQVKSRASSRSSLSSVPASVPVHPLNQMKPMPSMNVHDKLAGYTLEEDEASFGGFDGPPRPIRTIRQREAAFRKPSSVRAMQMHTEDEADDDEYLTPPRRRAGMRSPGSSPLKRSPYSSPNASANKPKVKKEYPLVLLHCNLLAPSLPVPGAVQPQNQKLVEEVLPTPYWKRWRRLQEKVGSGVLRDRGVLISHPEDLYDMLEERLLESLELQRPRLHQGHFLGHEESGPGSEGEVSDRGESETDGEQGEECLDCGGRVLRHGDTNRKWEIKVFAANGLMRAGAWAAAWKEMEKVDVEVGLWLPSDVRRALEKRLAEERKFIHDEETHPAAGFDEAGHLDMDHRRLSVQTHTRTFSDTGSFQADPSSKTTPTNIGLGLPEAGREKGEHEIALQTLVINYVRVLASDRRNIALVLMSVLVVFLAIGSRPQQSLQPAMHPFPSDMPEFSVVPSVNEAASAVPVALSGTAMESIASSAVASMPVSETSIPSSTEEFPLPSSIVDTEMMSVDPAETTHSTDEEAFDPETPDVKDEDEADEPAVETLSDPAG